MAETDEGDGHAVRRITTDGRVATVLGSVAQSGFLDLPGGDDGPAGLPCLNGPFTLAAGPGRVHISDTGNHALRAWDPATGALRTLAGDPGQDGVHWGLLRDGLEAFPGEGYGTLREPRGLAWACHGRAGDILYLTTGPCLAQIPGPCLAAGASPRVALEAPRAVPAGAPFQVTFQVPNERNDRSPSEVADFHYTVEFLEADGSSAGPERRGEGSLGVPVEVAGWPCFLQGRAKVRVRCVTLDGVSGAAAATVEVN